MNGSLFFKIVSLNTLSSNSNLHRRLDRFLKANATLKKYAEDALSAFTETYASDYTKHYVNVR